VAELPVRHVVHQALNQVARIFPGDSAILEQLGLEALDAADDLLEATAGRGVLRDPVVVVLLREVVNVATALWE
jgi:hypothetical protein